ncbi:MAG: hypothetical protein AAGC99_12130, partial [Pseudomonadota bacterium]
GKTALNGFSRRQWLLALAIAVLIHGSITYVVLRSPPDAGSIAAGAGDLADDETVDYVEPGWRLTSLARSERTEIVGVRVFDLDEAGLPPRRELQLAI